VATFIDDIKLKFKQGDLLVKLIFINVAIFLVLNIIGIIFKLFQVGNPDLVGYLSVPSQPNLLLVKPWTLFTYMFVHYEILHILFNMLVLYWFGRLFLSHFNERQLVGMYILGGLSGAIFYILAFNVIPYYVNLHSVLLGASASVMAIVFGIAFYRPNLKVNFLFVGSVKVLYIALIMFAIDFISLDDMANPGGHVAHIGGAIAGYIFALGMQKGKDISSWVNRIMDVFVNLFSSLTWGKKKSKLKVTYSRREKDYEYNQRKHKQEVDLDKILDKIKQSGYDSLSSEEKKRLFDASKK
jgi:membrane associated rhomboid family serine protease